MATMAPPGGAVDVTGSPTSPGAENELAKDTSENENNKDNNDDSGDQDSQKSGQSILATIEGEGGVETIFTAESLKKLRAIRNRNSGVFRFFRHKRHADQSPAAVALWMTSDHRPERQRKTKRKSNAVSKSSSSSKNATNDEEADELLNLSISPTFSSTISSLHHNQQNKLVPYEDMLAKKFSGAECSFFDGLVDSFEARFASAQWQAIENTLSCTPYDGHLPALEHAESTELTLNNDKNGGGGGGIGCLMALSLDENASSSQKRRALKGAHSNGTDDDDSSSSSSSSSTTSRSMDDEIPPNISLDTTRSSAATIPRAGRKQSSSTGEMQRSPSAMDHLASVLLGFGSRSGSARDDLWLKKDSAIAPAPVEAATSSAADDDADAAAAAVAEDSSDTIKVDNECGDDEAGNAEDHQSDKDSGGGGDMDKLDDKVVEESVTAATTATSGSSTTPSADVTDEKDQEQPAHDVELTVEESKPHLEVVEELKQEHHEPYKQLLVPPLNLDGASGKRTPSQLDLDIAIAARTRTRSGSTKRTMTRLFDKDNKDVSSSTQAHQQDEKTTTSASMSVSAATRESHETKSSSVSSNSENNNSNGKRSGPIRKVFKKRHPLKGLLSAKKITGIRSSLATKQQHPEQSDALLTMEEQQQSSISSSSTKEDASVAASAAKSMEMDKSEGTESKDQTLPDATSEPSPTASVHDDAASVGLQNDNGDASVFYRSSSPVEIVALNNSMGEDIVECCKSDSLQQLDREMIETFVHCFVKKDRNDKSATTAAASTNALPPQPNDLTSAGDDDVPVGPGLVMDSVSFSSSNNSNSIVRTAASSVDPSFPSRTEALQVAQRSTLCDVSEMFEIWDTNGVEQVVPSSLFGHETLEAQSHQQQEKQLAPSDRSVQTELTGRDDSEAADASVAASCQSTTMRQMEAYEEIYKSIKRAEEAAAGVCSTGSKIDRSDSTAEHTATGSVPSSKTDNLPLSQFRNEYPHVYERLVDRLGVEFLEEFTSGKMESKKRSATNAAIRDLTFVCGEGTESLLSTSGPSAEFIADTPISKSRSLPQKLRPHQKASAALQRMSPLLARSASPLFSRPDSPKLLPVPESETESVPDEAPSAEESPQQPLMSDEQSVRSDYKEPPASSSPLPAVTRTKTALQKMMQMTSRRYPKILSRKTKQHHELLNSDSDHDDDDESKGSGFVVGVDPPLLETTSSSSSTSDVSGSDSSASSKGSSSSSSSDGSSTKFDEDDETNISLAISNYGNTSFNDDDISLAAESVDTASLLTWSGSVSRASRSLVSKISNGNVSIKPSSSSLNVNKVKRSYPIRMDKYATIEEEMGVAEGAVASQEVVVPKMAKRSNRNSGGYQSVD